MAHNQSRSETCGGKEVFDEKSRRKQLLIIFVGPLGVAQNCAQMLWLLLVHDIRGSSVPPRKARIGNLPRL